jgi:hypothetical protein
MLAHSLVAIYVVYNMQLIVEMCYMIMPIAKTTLSVIVKWYQ